MTAVYHAFIDEAGDRGRSPRSTDHFVMSAVVVADADVPAASALLAKLRHDLKRRPGDPLHWQNLRTHSHRLHAAKTLGTFPSAHIASVVVCKRDLADKPVPDEDIAYLYTFRFLLERLSWFARDHDALLDYTLAAIVRFKIAKLRHYEQRLRADPVCKVAWSHLGAHGGRIDQPNRVELLQLADIAASATFKAFDPDEFGNTEVRYLAELSPRLYRRPPGPLTSYGLKMPVDRRGHSAVPVDCRALMTRREHVTRLQPPKRVPQFPAADGHPCSDPIVPRMASPSTDR